MKKSLKILYFCFTLISLISLSGCRENGFVIKGNLRNITASTAYLIHVNPVLNTVSILDSSSVEDNCFTFKGKVDYPIECQIKIGQRTTINLMVENSDIFISGSTKIPDEIKIRGSKSENEFQNLVETGQNYQTKKNTVWTNMLSEKTDSTRERKIKEKILTIEDSMLADIQHCVQENQSSVGAAYYVYYLLLDRQIDIERLEPIIKEFDSNIYDSEYVKYLRDEVKLKHANIEVGNIAPDFTICTTDGSQNLNLYQFKGKYLLLNFTSSWCEHREQKDKSLTTLLDSTDNLNIISIFIDKNKKKFEEKVPPIKRKDWFYASTFEYWETAMTKYYGINNIPYTILIDEDSKIKFINPTISQLDSIVSNKEHK